MSEKLKKIHISAMMAFDVIHESQQKYRQDALSSRRFCDVVGAQWEGSLGDQYENRPRFEINKLARSVARIYNEYRANRITVDFRPSNDESDSDVADLLDGMYRNDEQESNAQEAYDNAFQEGCKGGYGAFRLKNEYDDDKDEDNDNQHIIFEPIHDADISVFFDLDAKRYDKADARHCFVLVPYSKTKFKDEYPDANAVTWDNPLKLGFNWITADQVWVAEYYERESYAAKVFIYTLPQTGDIEKIRAIDFDDKDELEAAKQNMLDRGFEFTKERKIELHRVRKYILSGNEVLEDCGYIAGEYIPIIPYYGQRSVIEGVELAWGQVQNGRDSQRLYNSQVSAMAETAAFSQDQKPVFYPEEVAGHEYLWANDNIERNPFLLRNPLTGLDGSPIYGNVPMYTQPRAIAPATAALLEISNRDIQDVTGNIDQAQQVNNQTSGVAVQAVQNRLDMGVFGYMDNMAQTLRRCGEVWLSMRRAIEKTTRKVQTLAEDGTQGDAVLMQLVINPDTGADAYKNDISEGKYKVVVDVAPSFATRRDATLSKIKDMMQATADPAMQQILFNVAVQNMDGEGVQDLRAYSRKQLISNGVIKPNEAEQAEIQAAQEQAAANQQPNPQEVYLAAEAEKSRANAEKAAAETEKTRAQTLEIMQGIEAGKIDRALQILEMMNANLEQNKQLQADAEAQALAQQQQQLMEQQSPQQFEQPEQQL